MHTRAIAMLRVSRQVFRPDTRYATTGLPTRYAIWTTTEAMANGDIAHCHAATPAAGRLLARMDLPPNGGGGTRDVSRFARRQRRFLTGCSAWIMLDIEVLVLLHEPRNLRIIAL